MCNAAIENSSHLFIDCPFACSCWEDAAMQESINQKSTQAEGFTDLVFSILSSASAVFAENFAMIVGISGVKGMTNSGITSLYQHRR
ncbi:hypothetical protein DITRI_Ditri09bG0068000 [Diplodiscus trichospermus]